jgi:hypothetical protein
MSTQEIMAVVALGVLWLNSGLVLAVASKQLGNVLRLKRMLAVAREKGELVHGTAVRKSGAFAVRRIEMIGRAITTRGPERILFTDGPQSFEIAGGKLKTDAGEVAVAAAKGEQAELWTDQAREADSVRCGSGREFDAAYEAASTFKGFAHEVSIEARGGDHVWVFGTRRGDRIEPRPNGPLLVSTLDPIAYLNGRALLIAGFVAVALVLLAAITALAVVPPPFGLISTIGAALGLAYFLAIQPLGTALRDAVKTPARKLVGALWERPGENRAESRANA